MSSGALKNQFLAEAFGDAGLTLLGHQRDVYFFAKDDSGRFVLCNPACAHLLGAGSEAEVIGYTDDEFLPQSLCEGYRKDDHALLKTGRSLVDKAELVRHRDGSVHWHTTTKIAVRSQSGEIIGLAGVTRDSGKTMELEPPSAMAAVLEAMINGYAEPLTAAGLASKLSLSVRQFQRQFKRHFGTTPLRYLTRVRLDAARALLATTTLPLSDIALETGFYDQSHFTNQFVKHEGLTPLRYRETYARSVASPAAPVVSSGR